MPTHICKTCSADFYVKPAHVRLGYGKYCSRACHHDGMRRRIPVVCATCGRTVSRTECARKRSKSKRYFCNKSCQTKWRNTVFMGNRHKNWKGGQSSYRDVLKRSNIPLVCSMCKLTDERVLAVHHVDCDRDNNHPDNLIWLCHNCHHEVHYGNLGEQKLRRQ